MLFLVLYVKYVNVNFIVGLVAENSLSYGSSKVALKYSFPFSFLKRLFY